MVSNNTQFFQGCYLLLITFISYKLLLVSISILFWHRYLPINNIGTYTF